MVKNISDQISGVLFVFFSAFMYSTMPIMAKLAYASGLTPTNVLLLRYISAFSFLALYLKLQKKEPILCKSPWVIAQGILLILSALLYFYSAMYLSAGLVNVIFFIHPVLVAILFIIIYKQKLSRRIFAGLFLTLLGIFLISGLGQSLTDISVSGLILALFSSFSYSVYCLIGQRNIATISPLSLTTTFSFVGIAAFLIVNSHDLSFLICLNLKQIIIGLSIGFFNTVLGTLFFLKGLQKIGAAQASLIGSLEPVLTLIIAFMVLGEVLSPLELSGSILVIAGMVLAISVNIHPQS